MGSSRRFLALFVLSFPVAFAIEPIESVIDGSPSPVTFLHGLGIAILGFAWCRTDARERGVRRPAGAAVLCAVLAPVGVPYHLFRTRPPRQAALALLAAIGACALALALASAVLALRMPGAA